MRTIWKYDLATPVHGLKVPKGGIVRHVAIQPDGLGPDTAPMYFASVPSIWVEVDPDQPDEPRIFQVIGTGHPVPGEGEYIGTCMTADGRLVWHVYEMLYEGE